LIRLAGESTKVMSPPCERAMWRAIAKPKPLPPLLLVREDQRRYVLTATNADVVARPALAAADPIRRFGATGGGLSPL
jgi:hypothetical protein